MLIDDLETPARILGDDRWDEHASGPYLRVLFERDFAAGVEKLRGPALKQGSGESMHRTVDALCDAGRHEDAWEVLEAFTRYYRLPTRLKLVRRMIADGKAEAGLALAEAQLVQLAKWPLDAPAWVEILAEHAPERVEAHRPMLADSIVQAGKTYDHTRCFHPLARLHLRLGERAAALGLLDHQADDVARIKLLQVICMADHAAGEPIAGLLERMSDLVEQHSAAAEPRKRLEVALSQEAFYRALDDEDARARALADAYTHAAAAPSKDKRFRFGGIMGHCIKQGDLLEGHAALKRMPSGSRKYEVLALARAWIDAGHVTDAVQLVLRVPCRKESPFRIFERTFRMLQMANEAAHPGIKPLMPD